jgi:hypothetical protein
VAVVSEVRAPLAHDPAVPSPEAGRDRRRPWVASTGLVLVVVGLIVAAPFLVLCGVLLGAVSLALRRLPADLAVPAAALGCVAVASLLGIAAGLVGVDLVARPLPLALTLVAIAVATVVESRRPAPRRPDDVAGTRLVALAYVPAVLALGSAALQGFTARAAASWAFYGTDLVQHMAILKDVVRTGSLDYVANGYPRGLHMLLALVSSSSLPDSGPSDLLAYDLRLVASADWLALALVLSTAASLTLRLGAAWGLRPSVRVLAGVLAPMALLLTNSFIVAFVYLGAVPSLVALVALWAVPLATLELARRGELHLGPLVLIGLGATAVLANLWQPLVIVPALSVAGTLASSRRPAWRPPSAARTRGVVGAAVLVSAMAILLPFLALLRAGGSSLASIAGVTPAVPGVVLALTLLATGLLVRRRSDPAARTLLGAAVGVVVVAGVLLHGTGKLDVTQYYVMKSLWFLAVLLVPVVSLGVASLGSAVAGTVARGIDRLGAAARVARVAVIAGALAAFVAFVLPVGVVAGSDAWDAVADPGGRSESARAYDVAARYGTAFAPAVTVPVEVGSGEFPNIFTTYIVSKAISFQTGQPLTDGPAFDVCSAVRTVAGSRPAVVVTTLDPAVLLPFMVADGCGDVRVVRVAGSHRVLQHVPDARTATASRD